MTATRRLTVAAVVVTYLQLVFGGIVRITGSGMGCGDHWPKCNGSWIPPFDQPIVMIEWTHRLMALLVVLTLGASAWVSRRAATDERGRSVARAATAGFILVVAVALLGMITVKLGNSAFATVAHWTLAMTLLAVLLAAAVRSGAMGGDVAAAQGGTGRATRSLSAGAALALAVVVAGALVAKVPGAAAACPSFPLCGTPAEGNYANVRDIQIGHRVLAFFLFFHTLAVWSSIRRRKEESRIVSRVAGTAAALVVLQLIIGASMIWMVLPTPLRIAHEATGVAVWMTLFLASYLARSAAVKGT
jgi:heme A synthase